MLGGFGASLFGRMTNAETTATTHTAATGTVHGAVSAATANQIIVRDANARALVADPPVSDDSGLIATTKWVNDNVSGGSVTNIITGVGLTGGPITTTGTIDLADTAVTPGTYTVVTLTVDQQGRLTSASSGSAITSVGGSAPVVSSGGSTPSISMVAATASVPGHATAAQITKLNAIEALAAVNDVDTVFGRVGAVVAAPNDYNITDIDGVTISDASPSGGANGDIWFEY